MSPVVRSRLLSLNYQENGAGHCNSSVIVKNVAKRAIPVHEFRCVFKGNSGDFRQMGIDEGGFALAADAMDLARRWGEEAAAGGIQGSRIRPGPRTIYCALRNMPGQFSLLCIEGTG